METFPGLRARVLRDAAVAALPISGLALASVFWELPELISGHRWHGTARHLSGHLLVVIAGAHLVMIVFGYRRGRDLKQAVQHNELLALHDPLTGLPNRVLFFDRL
ncbi:MAG TPA: GGDEF domain-containing protein, partial [Nonomuraea sp.]|nr:GGDEF domain-containing protein [Nonomuraea sp.]